VTQGTTQSIAIILCQVICGDDPGCCGNTTELF